MQHHTKIYFDFFGIDPGDFVPCEVCGGPAVDIHHIEARGMGGNPTRERNNPTNLMALCRHDHLRAELQAQPYLRAEELFKIHQATFEQHGKLWPQSE